jgi:signal peptidase I
MAKTTQAGFWASTKEIIVLLLIVLAIRTFGFGLYQVPTGSMETTMLRGERFFADKLTIFFSPPKRGDVIVMNAPTFKYSDNIFVRLYQEYIGFPWGPDNWTKRVIGVPGDTIKGVVENGKPVVYRNGEKLEESYINKYPLIASWKDPVYAGQPWDRLLENIHATAVQEAWQNGVSVVGNDDGVKILEREIIEHGLWDGIIKSYDSTVPFAKQPFYRMSEQDIVRIPKDYRHEGITVTADGLVLKEPGTPLVSSLQPVSVKPGQLWNGTDEFEIKLGADEYWGMGDNRRGSWDSRAFGPILGKNIRGKVLFRIWSLDTDESWPILDLIKHPIDFWKRVRWNRIFDRVR